MSLKQCGTHQSKQFAAIEQQINGCGRLISIKVMSKNYLHAPFCGSVKQLKLQFEHTESAHFLKKALSGNEIEHIHSCNKRYNLQKRHLKSFRKKVLVALHRETAEAWQCIAVATVNSSDQDMHRYIVSEVR
uniref:AlNc14C133G7022 protein n=1 Tax=Albugo laibachii Nc14 TaxID=890382 RepID=F0WKH1_9STRA|nr:AlNc14C133G7022 [Albugo laibachii Nc14]|eukprot:CCA21775.1 AlNc14C133G7022 [Albugo laibachii Nc14]